MCQICAEQAQIAVGEDFGFDMFRNTLNDFDKSLHNSERSQTEVLGITRMRQDGWIGGCMLDGWMGQYIGGWVDTRTDGRMDRRTDGRADGRTDRRMGGRAGGRAGGRIGVGWNVWIDG